MFICIDGWLYTGFSGMVFPANRKCPGCENCSKEFLTAADLAELQKLYNPPTQETVTVTTTKMTPSIGRKVWFWPLGEAQMDQPHDATVCFVNVDGTVNLRCTTEQGYSYAEHDVVLVDPTDEAKPGNRYATWMPYQIGQAQKQADAETIKVPPDGKVGAAAAAVLGIKS